MPSLPSVTQHYPILNLPWLYDFPSFSVAALPSQRLYTFDVDLSRSLCSHNTHIHTHNIPAVTISRHITRHKGTHHFTQNVNQTCSNPQYNLFFLHLHGTQNSTPLTSSLSILFFWVFLLMLVFLTTENVQSPAKYPLFTLHTTLITPEIKNPRHNLPIIPHRHNRYF